VNDSTRIRDLYRNTNYADQRFYASTYGRFLTPDRKGGKGRDPGTLNKYSYTRGDPVNRNDPRGLCDVVVGGITESSSSNTDSGFANQIGAMQAYPYQGTDKATGVLTVMVNGVEATAQGLTAADAIEAAAADSPGPINLFGFSGGAAAITNALGLLPQSILSRIASITYASPGNFGTLGTVNGITPTVILATGLADNLATLGTTIPLGWNIVDAPNCGHDADCEYAAANAANSAGNACDQPSTFSVQNLNFGQALGESVVYGLGAWMGAFWYPYFQTFAGVEQVTSMIDWEIDWTDSTITFQ